MNVAFVTAECIPFAKTGGLADVCGALPKVLAELGVQVSIFMPKYQCVDGQQYTFEQVCDGVFKVKDVKRFDVYCIDCPDFFDRAGLYGDERGDYSDNLQRFDAFNRGVLEAVKALQLDIDIFHCHDWQAGLIPVYLKYVYADDSVLKKAKTVFTIHNLAYQGLFPREMFSRLPFEDEVLERAGFYFYGKISVLRAGIVSSDRVTTVSPQYAREIQMEQLGCGMADVLKPRGEALKGILNGLDTSIWDPEHDGLIASRYSSQTPGRKLANKQELQNMCGLPSRPDVSVFGFVGRFSHQKGISLIVESASTILENDVQMVFLGVGDKVSEETLCGIMDRYPNKVAVHCTFDERLAHCIYAGSDFFIMPSVYEPCGLSQMISLKYGTLPIVFATGGLIDTVKDVDEGGNGFMFHDYSVDAFVDCIHRAIELFKNSSEMDEVVAKAFGSRFFWEDSAKRYLSLYQSMQEA